MKQTYLQLNDGNLIPQFGLGVYQIPGDEETKKTCLTAFKLGYRHIDTAHAYQNERGVGQAFKESGLTRDEVWITSKLWPSEYGTDKTSLAIDKMLNRLGLEYLDLLLLHQPFGDYRNAWKEMEKAVGAGKVRSIGLSNFEGECLEEIFALATIKPSVLQVECHPYYQQDELKTRLTQTGTILESWYPIGHGDQGLIGEPLFTQLATKYHKTNTQIILRWQIQEGNVVFPKSTNPQHLAENIQIFEFSLTEEEMKAIKALDQKKRFFTWKTEELEAYLLKFIPED